MTRCADQCWYTHFHTNVFKCVNCGHIWSIRMHREDDE